jgi:YnbE-like lipoprotein
MMPMTRHTPLKLGLAGALILSLGACISVKTPDKPIEINLNVTIRQEVLVRLQRDVDQLIKQNPEAFPGTPALPGSKP